MRLTVTRTLGMHGRQRNGDWGGGEIVHGDIVDFTTVHNATEGMDAIVHLAVYFGSYDGNEPTPIPNQFEGTVERT